MTRHEMQAFVDRWVRAWTTKDLEALLACYDEHAELFSPVFHTVRGTDGIERSHQNLFLAFSDVVTDVHEVIIDVEEQRAVLVFTIHATHRGEFLGFPPSGRRTATPSAFVFNLKDGRIILERRLYDFGGFMMQLGILKTKSV